MTAPRNGVRETGWQLADNLARNLKRSRAFMLQLCFEGEAMSVPKLTILTVLCALIAFSACRREEPTYERLKLGGPTEQPAR
jgi:hypothetical protein